MLRIVTTDKALASQHAAGDNRCAQMIFNGLTL
ncbi:MAG: hypothetical protein ACFWUJ_14525 [Pseudomonas fragi]